MRTWSLTWKYAENTPSRSTLSRSLAFGELLCAPACPALGSSLLARLNKVVYAASRRITESSSGVMLGRKCSVGKTASSKTLARPVSRSIFAGNFSRNASKMRRPRLRILVVASSRSARITGMKRGHCLLNRSDCMRLLAVKECPRVSQVLRLVAKLTSVVRTTQWNTAIARWSSYFHGFTSFVSSARPR